jgi:hypothetical protein
MIFDVVAARSCLRSLVRLLVTLEPDGSHSRILAVASSGFRNTQTAFKAWGYTMLRQRRLRATHIKILYRWDGWRLNDSFNTWRILAERGPSVATKLRAAHDLIAEAMSCKHNGKPHTRHSTSTHATPDRSHRHGTDGVAGGGIPFSPRTAIVL